MNEILLKKNTKSINFTNILTDIEKSLIKEEIINKQNSMLSDITTRSSIGSIEIYPKVLLPHIKQHYIKKTRIILVKNRSVPIIWQKKEINLIILILMPINVNEHDKTIIRNFMKDLANENYIKKLIIKE